MVQRTKNDGDDLNECLPISDKCTLQKPGCDEFDDYDHVNADHHHHHHHDLNEGHLISALAEACLGPERTSGMQRGSRSEMIGAIQYSQNHDHDQK